MENTDFNDLSIRLNTKYIYVHQGDCTHVMSFTSIRKIDKTDNNNKNEYPIQTYQNRVKKRRCTICEISAAK
jgi:snRNA-activating protein complex subunit 3